jgi:hypothetical protein
MKLGVVRRVPVGTHGQPEGVQLLVPDSFALQDLLTPALAPQAAARRARTLQKHVGLDVVQGLGVFLANARRVQLVMVTIPSKIVLLASAKTVSVRARAVVRHVLADSHANTIAVVGLVINVPVTALR